MATAIQRMTKKTWNPHRCSFYSHMKMIYLIQWPFNDHSVTNSMTINMNNIDIDISSCYKAEKLPYTRRDRQSAPTFAAICRWLHMRATLRFIVAVKQWGSESEPGCRYCLLLMKCQIDAQTTTIASSVFCLCIHADRFSIDVWEYYYIKLTYCTCCQPNKYYAELWEFYAHILW